MKVLLTVVTGFVMKGEIRELRSTSEEMYVARNKNLANVVNKEVDAIRRRFGCSARPVADVLSVSHSIFP